MFSKKIRGKWQSPVEINYHSLKPEMIAPHAPLTATEHCFSCTKPIILTEIFIRLNMSMVHGPRSKNLIKTLTPNITNRMHQSLQMGKSSILQATGMEDREDLIFIFQKRMLSGDWGPAINLGTYSKYNI